MRRPPSSYSHGKSERRDRPRVADVATKVQKVLGRLLRHLREVRKLSQSEAAELAGLHPNAVSRIETGKQNVTILTLVAFSVAYGVSFDALFVGNVRKTKAIAVD